MDDTSALVEVASPIMARLCERVNWPSAESLEAKLYGIFEVADHAASYARLPFGSQAARPAGSTRASTQTVSKMLTVLIWVRGI